MADFGQWILVLGNIQGRIKLVRSPGALTPLAPPIIRPWEYPMPPYLFWNRCSVFTLFYTANQFHERLTAKTIVRTLPFRCHSMDWTWPMVVRYPMRPQSDKLCPCTAWCSLSSFAHENSRDPSTKDREWPLRSHCCQTKSKSMDDISDDWSEATGRFNEW